MPVVWMDSWQQQCCGKPFEVGSHVEWTVDPLPEGIEVLGRILGDELRRGVEVSENHHWRPDGAVTGVVAGVVERILVVTSTCVTRDRKVVLDPGGGHLRDVVQCDSWEPEPPAGASWIFLGWILHVRGTFVQTGR